MGAPHAIQDPRTPSLTAEGIRPDERGVRVLFVEHSPDYAALVCETLEGASQGTFDIRRAPQLDAAAEDLAFDGYDAVLLDCAPGPIGSRDRAIERAARLASRLPVILLTADEKAMPDPREDPCDADTLRDAMARSRLPGAILGAVRRHRRLGQQNTSEPIVHRFEGPLRCAKAKIG